MAEIKREPMVVTFRDSEDEWTIFDQDHTFADFARYIHSQGGSEDTIYYLNQLIGPDKTNAEA